MGYEDGQSCVEMVFIGDEDEVAKLLFVHFSCEDWFWYFAILAEIATPRYYLHRPLLTSSLINSGTKSVIITRFSSITRVSVLGLNLIEVFRCSSGLDTSCHPSPRCCSHCCSAFSLSEVVSGKWGWGLWMKGWFCMMRYVRLKNILLVQIGWEYKHTNHWLLKRR